MRTRTKTAVTAVSLAPLSGLNPRLSVSSLGGAFRARSHRSGFFCPLAFESNQRTTLRIDLCAQGQHAGTQLGERTLDDRRVTAHAELDVPARRLAICPSPTEGRLKERTPGKRSSTSSISGVSSDSATSKTIIERSALEWLLKYCSVVSVEHPFDHRPRHDRKTGQEPMIVGWRNPGCG